MSKTFRLRTSEANTAINYIFSVKAKSPKVSNVLKYRIIRKANNTDDILPGWTGPSKQIEVELTVWHNEYWNGVVFHWGETAIKLPTSNGNSTKQPVQEGGKWRCSYTMTVNVPADGSIGYIAAELNFTNKNLYSPATMINSNTSSLEFSSFSDIKQWDVS